MRKLRYGIVFIVVLLFLSGCLIDIDKGSYSTIGDGVWILNNGKIKPVDISTISGSVTIPSSVNGHTVEGIDDTAFEYCKSLESITIPNSVKSIGKSAFHGCTGLNSIAIPASVTSIGENAFEDCNPSSFKNNSSVVLRYIFSSSVYHVMSSPSELTISALYTGIGDRAFNYSSTLTSVIIPNSVTAIGDYAFASCSHLSNISFSGSMTQWDAISKGNSWAWNIDATVVHCLDGDVAI